MAFRSKFALALALLTGTAMVAVLFLACLQGGRWIPLAERAVLIAPGLLTPAAFVLGFVIGRWTAPVTAMAGIPGTLEH
jgi:hypothetical protein